MNTLVLVIGWTLAGFVGLIGLVIIWLIIRGRIDLSNLISEPDGHASLSRFQFLIFTFVIALSLFLMIANTLKFPEIPGGILALMGISGGSYVIAKGIQTSKEVGITEAMNQGTGDGNSPATVTTASAAVTSTSQQNTD